MENSEIITVLTPSYNRAGLLENLYISLFNQEKKNFDWLIIDDGSCDNTEEVVTSFQCEEISIYYYKRCTPFFQRKIPFGNPLCPASRPSASVGGAR